MSIEAANGCTFDFLLFMSNSGRPQERPEARFCGSTFDEDILSFWGPVEVEFLSDGSVQEEGFQLYYFVERDDEGSGGGAMPDPGKISRKVFNLVKLLHEKFILHLFSLRKL